MVARTDFSRRYQGSSGIQELMVDLDLALSGPKKMLMLGGGNPGRIPEMEEFFRKEMEDLMQDADRFERALGIYDHPGGNVPFRRAIADLLRQDCGWDVAPENIALTQGSQNAFFLLMNLLGGKREDGSMASIVFPMSPEYIGYEDVGIQSGTLKSFLPKVRLLEDNSFRYEIDFDGLQIDDSTGAVCLSRPCNPTGNNVSDEELERLYNVCSERQVPLLIDAAYGLPFPGIVFDDSTPFYREGCIVILSLSKLGLPGLRTGIVVAPPDMVAQIEKLNSIFNLSCGGMGPALVRKSIETGTLLKQCRNILQPHYRKARDLAVRKLKLGLGNCGLRVHESGGAFFLWLWFDASISTTVLYQKLKEAGVIVVPGKYYFPGLEDEFDHRDRCIRLSFSQDLQTIEEGIDTLIRVTKRELEGIS
ncbi:MAG: valine--pyruvate transaminase [Leptospiraceae bacterium]|nr:valine--pyruvate transaminase [Leptospiraceae bacterium]